MSVVLIYPLLNLVYKNSSAYSIFYEHVQLLATDYGLVR